MFNAKYQILNIKYSNRGLTLLEVLVALAVFVFLIFIAMGIFLAIINTQRKVTAVRVLQDSVRYTIEAISRDIRTGYGFSVASQSELRFTSTLGGGIRQVSYRLNVGRVEKGIFDGGRYTFLPLTPPDLRVDYLNFFLSGEAVDDGFQPRITITLGASAGQGSFETKVNVQTTLSQRELQS